MTTHPFTPEEMKAIAEVVYPGRQFQIIAGVVSFMSSTPIGLMIDRELLWFMPSLTGTELQRAQACDVIVAAQKWAGAWQVYEQFNDDTKNVYLTGIVLPPGIKDCDPLTAAALALLESGK